MTDHYEEHMRMGVMPGNLEPCHYLKATRVGDEGYYWCELSDHPCMVEYGDDECEEYNEFLKELNEEKTEEPQATIATELNRIE